MTSLPDMKLDGLCGLKEDTVKEIFYAVRNKDGVWRATDHDSINLDLDFLTLHELARHATRSTRSRTRSSASVDCEVGVVGDRSKHFVLQNINIVATSRRPVPTRWPICVLHVTRGSVRLTCAGGEAYRSAARPP